MFKKFSPLFLFGVIMFTGSDLFAVEVPTDGDLMFTFYDVLINDVIKGPIGAAAGVVGIIFTGFMAVKGQIFPALLGVAATATAFGAESIVSTFGIEIIGTVVKVIG